MTYVKLRGDWNRKMGDEVVNLKLCLSILIFFLAIQIVSAADDFKPYLHQASVGEDPKLRTFGVYQTNLFPGAGTYSYSIEVPTGIVGLEPSLSISYSSQSAIQRLGIVGAGWLLTKSSMM